RDGVTAIGLDELTLRATARPEGALQIDAEGGATRVDAVGGAGATLTPTGQLRVRWREPMGGPAVDFRARRNVIDASPFLVTNRVVRTEIGAIVELPLASRLKLRGIGRTAALSSSFDLNHRTSLAGVVAVAVTPSVELSGQMHEIRYSRPSSAGYFAPRLIQMAQVGSYIELETARSVVLAFDLGVGVQRVAQQVAAIGPWRSALRLYSLIAVLLAACVAPTPGAVRQVPDPVSTRYINPGTLAALPGFTHAVRIGPTLYVSGEVALDSTGRLVGPGDVGAQAAQAFANLATVLRIGGAAPADVAKLTIYVV